MFDGLGDVDGFLRIEIHRLAFVNSAKTAVPSASVAAEHKCRGLVRPALKNIRAFRFLANRMQVQPADQIEHGVLVARIAELYLQPIRLPQPLAMLAVEKILN